jgi:spermidine/putrescine transport system substrate-binding protein
MSGFSRSFQLSRTGLGSALGVMLLVGSALTGGGQASAAGKLKLYNWGDYINPKVLQRFSEEHDVEVSLDTYGSNEEMLAKIQAGATGYDIVFPSVHMHDIMHKLGLLWKSNINEHPLFDNIDKDFLRAKTDPKGEWCLPYAWGTVGIFYNKNLVQDVESWEDFFAIPDEHGEDIIMLPDMREVISVGLIMNDLSVNTTSMDDLEVAQEYILERKPDISAFTYDGARSSVLSGDAAAAQWYVGAMMHVMENPEKYDYVIPEEGTNFWVDNLAIPVDAPNPELAHAFIDYVLDPQVSADIANYTAYGSPNATAIEEGLIDEELLNNPGVYPSEETQERMFEVVQDSELEQLYNDAWDEIRIRVGQ